MLKERSDKEIQPLVSFRLKVESYGLLGATAVLIVFPLANTLYSALSGVFCAL
jgi:hypothetical protein